MDDSLRASCISLVKPSPDKLERPQLRSKPSLSSSLTSIPDETRDNIVAAAFKRSLSTRRKTNKDRKEKERGRSKRSVTQKVLEKELRKALAHDV